MDESVIKIIRDYFKDQPVKEAYIFGSYARGEQTEKSDIDILTVLDYSQYIGLNFFGWQNELQELLGRKVDLISDGGVSKHIKPLIDKDKILIYER
jgi:uncharacterized protein